MRMLELGKFQLSKNTNEKINSKKSKTFENS